MSKDYQDSSPIIRGINNGARGAEATFDNPYTLRNRDALHEAHQLIRPTAEQDNSAITKGIMALAASLGKGKKEKRKGFLDNLAQYASDVAAGYEGFANQQAANEKENLSLADKLKEYYANAEEKALKREAHEIKRQEAKERLAIAKAHLAIKMNKSKGFSPTDLKIAEHDQHRENYIKSLQAADKILAEEEEKERLDLDRESPTQGFFNALGNKFLPQDYRNPTQAAIDSAGALVKENLAQAKGIKTDVGRKQIQSISSQNSSLAANRAILNEIMEQEGVKPIERSKILMRNAKGEEFYISVNDLEAIEEAIEDGFEEVINE